MKNRMLGGAGVLAIGLLAAACSSGGGAASPSPTAEASPSASSPAAAQAGFPVKVDGQVADLALREVPGLPGKVLVDGKGRAVYMFSKDVYGKPSACKGACATAWEPILTESPKLGPGVDEGSICVATQPDGRVQICYNGYLLYHFNAGGGDTDSGPANGQGKTAFGGKWWVLGKDGNPVKSG
jgi:predicted lipoprotein with Yx(FWY)xxD motif